MVGDGSTSNPYQITTATELQSMSNNLTANYVLKNNIDCSSINNFIPIGDNTNKFSGSLDGNNFSISCATITSTGSYLGLFGATNNATLKNFSIDYMSINGSKTSSCWVGGLAGKLYLGTATNIKVNNININAISGIGGFCGHAWGNISKCCVDGGTINCGSDSGIGGFFGMSNYCSVPTTIEECYSNNVRINGNTSSDIGGFGGAIGNYLIIQNCFSHCEFWGSTFLGGFIGTITKITYPTIIQNCFSNCYIHTTQWQRLDGFADCQDTSLLTLSNCYFDKNNAIITDDHFHIGRTTAQMETQSNYVNYDFNNIWSIQNGQSYPTLKCFMPKIAKTGNIDVLSYINSLYMLDDKNKNIAKDTTIYSNITNYTDSITKSKQTINNIYTNSIDGNNQVSKICNKDVSMYINTIMLDIVRQLGNVLNVNVNMYSASAYVGTNTSRSKYKDSTLYVGNIYNICNKIVQKCVDSNVDISDIHMSCTYSKVKNKDVLSYINVLDSKDTIITKVNIDDVQVFLQVLSHSSNMTVEELETKLGITTHDNILNVEEGL